MGDLRPPLDPLFRTFGVPATVTPPGGAAIATTVIVGARHASFPGTEGFTVAELRRLVSVRRDQVPSTPADTVIVTTEGTFTVDGIAQEDREIALLVTR